MIRRTVNFRGRVQGVGFRYTVVDCVGDLGVTGTVRNLPDGSVEAIFVGEADTIEAILGRVRQKMATHIDAERSADSPATGEFADFSIRR